MSKMQEVAIKKVLEGHSLQITGQAGTGKTFVLQQMYRALLDNGQRPKILCTTGIACLQYESAQTVHSWAGLRDGRYDDLTLARLVSEDDAMDHVRQNVLNTGVLLIDEVSMLSKKDFEQLELVCRTLLNKHKNFGGLQVVASGDFYQLPPVGNTLYGDSGKFCFESPIWKTVFVHKIDLEKVLRQNEPQLMRAVSETARGAVSNETDEFLKGLQRNLETCFNPVHLFPNNFDAQVFNHEQLNKLNSEGKVYVSTQKGANKHLKKILAPNYLHLKVGCLVILLRNLGGKLLNGLRGVVTKLSEDTVTVLFETKQTHNISRYNFTVFDIITQDSIAERRQFPLCLAYGLTIHKSQGLTLNSVCIHCKGIFETGQFSVALGRGTHSAGIQLIGYKKSLCFQPKAAVTEFYRIPHAEFQENLRCCKLSANVCIPDPSLDCYDSDDSDFDEGDIDVIQSLFDSHEDSSVSHEHSDEDIIFPDYISLENIKESVTVLNPITEKQKQIKEICSSISDMRMKKFLYENYKHFKNFFSSSDTPTTPKIWTDILSKYHNYISNAPFKETLYQLYGESTLTDEQVYVGSNFAYRLLNVMVHALASEISRTPETSKQQHISEAGKAKLRYVAGMCVSKAKQHFCGIITNQLGNEKRGSSEKFKTNMEKVTLLRSLQAEEDEIDRSDKTFAEVEQRQNVRRGLTYINDQCFHFFLNVDGKIRGILTAESLKYEREDLFETAKASLLNDEGLQILWDDLSMGITSDVSSSIYQNLLSLFLMVTQKQFLKDMKDKLSLKKKKAHREEIKETSEKRKIEVALSYQDITGDKSEKRISSHLKLKCNCIADEKFLDLAFTKTQLLTLCEAYQLQCSKTFKKTEISKLLLQGILNSNEMTYSNAFDLRTTEPVASSSKRPRKTKTTVPGKGKGKGKGCSRKTKKTLCGGCNKEYNDDEDWVECSFCREWFDRACAGLNEDSDWSRILDEDVDWECQNCKA